MIKEATPRELQEIFIMYVYMCYISVKVTQSCLTLCNPWDSPWDSPWHSPGQNTGVGSFSLFQGIFPTQRLNPGLLHCRRVLYQLSVCVCVCVCVCARARVHARVLSCFSIVWLFATLWMVAHQAPLSMEFSRQEYWGELLCPAPGGLQDPEIEPASLMSPALASRFFIYTYIPIYIYIYMCVCVCVCVTFFKGK